MARALAVGTMGQELQARGSGRVSAVAVNVIVGVNSSVGVIEAVKVTVGLSVGGTTVEVCGVAGGSVAGGCAEAHAANKPSQTRQPIAEYPFNPRIRTAPLGSERMWPGRAVQRRSSRGRR